MPVYNITIPDTSPVIVYAGGWNDSWHSDQNWVNYTNGTFHATSNALASLSFNGSAVYVVGAKRLNHGDYLATLDGDTSTGNGNMIHDTFNSILYSKEDLSSQEHQLVMQNKWTDGQQTWFDIDYITLTVGDNKPNTISHDVVLDDGDTTNVTYSDGWENNPNGLQTFYYKQTMHATNVIGASAYILFHGNAIHVYGATSSNHGLFSITLDGIPVPGRFNGSAPGDSPRWQNLLYYSGGLSTDMHNLTVTHNDTTEPALWFDLDKVVVSTWATSNPNASHTNNGDSELSKGAIAGISVAAAIGVVLLSASFFWWRRRHQHSNTNDIRFLAMKRNRTLGVPSPQSTIEPFIISDRRTQSASRLGQLNQNTHHGPMSGVPCERDPGISTVRADAGTEAGMLGNMINIQRDFPPPAYEEVIAEPTAEPTALQARAGPTAMSSDLSPQKAQ